MGIYFRAVGIDNCDAWRPRIGFTILRHFCTSCFPQTALPQGGVFGRWIAVPLIGAQLPDEGNLERALKLESDSRWCMTTPDVGTKSCSCGLAWPTALLTPSALV
jgi:hypothetical protein